MASENKMHDDATAARFGFLGGLVPGVGVYGYMTIAAVREFGAGWLERGTMWAKFLKPVYDGETVNVECEVISGNPRALDVKIVNTAGVVCAVARVDETHGAAGPDIAVYPMGTLPEPDRRPLGDLEHITAGATLGGFDAVLDLPNLRGESGALFADEMVDDSPLYRGGGARCHPGFYPAMANRILSRNVTLGPWIHTESSVHHFRSLRNGETLKVRGRVTQTETKRGHEFVYLDVALFGDSPTAAARVMHSAIVKPATVGHGA